MGARNGFARGNHIAFCHLSVKVYLQVGEGRAQDVLEGMPHAARSVVGPGGRGVVDEVLIHQLLEAGAVALGDDFLVEALDGELIAVE